MCSIYQQYSEFYAMFKVNWWISKYGSIDVTETKTSIRTEDECPKTQASMSSLTIFYMPFNRSSRSDSAFLIALRRFSS